MTITNQQIYQYYRLLEEAFFLSDEKNVNFYISAKVNFFINKNRQTLATAYSLIEKERQNIILHYGTQQADLSILVPEEKIQAANQELEELLSVEQNLNIAFIKLSDIEQYEFTPKQMEALFFMIKED